MLPINPNEVIWDDAIDPNQVVWDNSEAEEEALPS